MNKYTFIIVLNLIVILYFIFALCTPYVELGMFNNSDLLYYILIYIVVSPIFEEYIFRRLILKNLLLKFKKILISINVNNNESIRISIANIITSLLFIVSHYVIFGIYEGYSVDLLILSMLYFIPSIVLGMLYEFYKNIYFPIEFHMILNFNVFLVYIL